MRAFISIELPDPLKKSITQFIKELQKLDFVDAKFAQPEQMHLTLKFLGEVPENKLAAIKAVLKTIAEQTKSLGAQLKGFGHFNYRVLWIGGNNGQKEISELAGSIDKELAKLGFAREPREYAVHLTVARVRYWKNKEKFKEVLEKYSTEDFGKFAVKEIKLMNSTLTTAGPIYEVLETFGFR